MNEVFDLLAGALSTGESEEEETSSRRTSRHSTVDALSRVCALLTAQDTSEILEVVSEKRMRKQK